MEGMISFILRQLYPRRKKPQAGNLKNKETKKERIQGYILPLPGI
jgi:hypothetical protein